jgi:hypothetical protein
MRAATFVSSDFVIALNMTSQTGISAGPWSGVLTPFHSTYLSPREKHSAMALG